MSVAPAFQPRSSAWRPEQEADTQIVTVEELDTKLMGLTTKALLPEPASAEE